MRGAVLYGPGDVRFEERAAPTIVEPTDAVIRMAATCVCGSNLWDYRGLNPVTQPKPMGHEYGGIAETQEVIDYCAARNIKADIGLIRPEGINRAYEQIVNKVVRYRFVIDIASMKSVAGSKS